MIWLVYSIFFLMSIYLSVTCLSNRYMLYFCSNSSFNQSGLVHLSGTIFNNGFIHCYFNIEQVAAKSIATLVACWFTAVYLTPKCQNLKERPTWSKDSFQRGFNWFLFRAFPPSSSRKKLLSFRNTTWGGTTFKLAGHNVDVRKRRWKGKRVKSLNLFIYMLFQQIFQLDEKQIKHRKLTGCFKIGKI